MAWYNCVKNEHADRTNEPSVSGIDDFMPETDFNDNTDDDPDSLNFTECKSEYKLKGGLKLVKRKKPKIIRSVRYQKDEDPENHYREKFMLYTPWRNESTDLINSSKTYQEQFQKVKTEVLCNRASTNTILKC